MAYQFIVSDIARELGTENTFFVTYKWQKKVKGKWVDNDRPKTDNYEVTWSYKNKNGYWFDQSPSSNNTKYSTYSPPDNAIAIRVKVRPIAKKEKKDGKEKAAWTYPQKNVKWVGVGKRNFYPLDPSYFLEAPGTPEVSMSPEGVLRAVLSNLDISIQSDYGRAVFAQFEVIEDDIRPYKGPFKVSITYNMASISLQTDRGHRYKVRALLYVADKVDQKKIQDSDWSEFSDNVSWGPGKVTGLTASAVSESEARLTWNKVGSAGSYEIQYTKDPRYFDSSSSQVQNDTVEGGNITNWFISDLDNTNSPTWYFRIRALDADSNNGEWSNIASTKLATKPEPPITWSYSTTAKIGEPVIFAWSHSSADGSTQTEAQIDVAYRSEWHHFSVSGDTQTYSFATDDLQDAQYVKWRVRTKGASSEWSDWSTEREFNAYEPPYVGVAVYEEHRWAWDPFNFLTDTIYTAYSYPYGDPISTVTKYPLVIGAAAGPEGQRLLSIAISITANQSYDTEDEYGLPQHIYEGEEVFSRVIDDPDENIVCLVLMPNEIDLMSDISYTIHVIAAMDSGLTAEQEYTFDVSLDVDEYEANAEITIDRELLTCSIRPYCLNEDDEEASDVILSVYRRSYDGSFVEIAKGLYGSQKDTVVDPHPSLDVGRYRIIGISTTNGTVFYNDVITDRIGHNSIVIQWAEEWSYFEADTLDTPSIPPWGGSMLQLPYNVDISADYSPDVALVNYIGREHPVAYYGTHRGESGRWSCEIKKSDVETLYAIRRLAHWMGDVYVREPSGIGYWANIVVSYQETHNKLTIPITFNVQRVDGGA